MYIHTAVSAIPARVKERAGSSRPSAVQLDRELQQYQREKERGSDVVKEPTASGAKEKPTGK